MEAYEWVVGVAAVLLFVAGGVGGVVAWKRWKVRRAETRLVRARELFHLRREWLEARFVSLYSQGGAPRGLECADCEFENTVIFARERPTGQLRALVGVTIGFKAVEGGGMEDNPNVGNLRVATAVFRFDGAEWSSSGEPKFNLNPAQVIAHYPQELETVD